MACSLSYVRTPAGSQARLLRRSLSTQLHVEASAQVVSCGFFWFFLEIGTFIALSPFLFLHNRDFHQCNGSNVNELLHLYRNLDHFPLFSRVNLAFSSVLVLLLPLLPSPLEASASR